jgi:phage protein D
VLRPAYKLTIGRRVVDSTDEPRASTLVELVVSLGLETPADGASLVFGNVDGLEPAPGDDAAVELGYADDGDLTQVLTGGVAAVDAGLTASRVTIHGTTRTLLRTFVDQTFEGKSAGAIVRDLADRAGVTVARADDGIEFPAYVVDGRRSVYEHLRDLAELSGFDLYADPQGELVFERFAGGRTVHVLEQGTHLLRLHGLRSVPRAGIVETWGESPGGGRGGESWAWLTKDFGPSHGSQGSGSPTLLVERPALRTAAAASSAAQAAATAISRRTLRGELTILGRPTLRPGDAVRLRGTEDGELDATFQVRGVTHRLGKRTGFTTVVDFRSIE